MLRRGDAGGKFRQKKTKETKPGNFFHSFVHFVAFCDLKPGEGRQKQHSNAPASPALFGCRHQSLKYDASKIQAMNTKAIQHTVLIRATPKAIYDALMNEKKHSQFTGERANIRAKAGAPFSCYDGYITGITLELEPAKLIVQAWRSQNWPAGTWSIVTFRLAKKSGGTQLRFTQIGVPANDYARKNNGWRMHYWQPLKQFLEK
jgi:activator of HSP90 ATPase